MSIRPMSVCLPNHSLISLHFSSVSLLLCACFFDMTKQRLSQALGKFWKFRLGAGELGSCINPGVQVLKCIEFIVFKVLKCNEQVY